MFTLLAGFSDLSPCLCRVLGVHCCISWRWSYMYMHAMSRGKKKYTQRPFGPFYLGPGFDCLLLHALKFGPFSLGPGFDSSMLLAFGPFSWTSCSHGALGFQKCLMIGGHCLSRWAGDMGSDGTRLHWEDASHSGTSSVPEEDYYHGLWATPHAHGGFPNENVWGIPTFLAISAIVVFPAFAKRTWDSRLLNFSGVVFLAKALFPGLKCISAFRNIEAKRFIYLNIVIMSCYFGGVCLWLKKDLFI